MYFIILVLLEIEKLDEVIHAWKAAGVSEITILPSVSQVRIDEKPALQEDFPLIPNLEDIFEAEERQNRTLFTVVKSDEMADTVYKATVSIIGDLSSSGKGSFVVLPILKAYGVNIH
jgi:hypothetical protein